MRIIVRGACFGYWALLSLALLHPDPWSLLGGRRMHVETPDQGVHFVLFSGLALLYQAGRFGLSRRAAAALLVGFAVAIESLQYFTPPRSVELRDYAENLLGLACGALIGAGVARMWRSAAERRSRAHQ